MTTAFSIVPTATPAHSNHRLPRRNRFSATATHSSPRGVCPRRRHFLNLSNGLEAASLIAGLAGLDAVRVTRLQSSQCEAQAFDGILRSLGPELMFSLAAGYDCYVYDFASRDAQRGVPRALFLGLQFVSFALAYLWFDERAESVHVRGHNVAQFWRDEVMLKRVAKKTRQMVRFYRPFAGRMAGGRVRLHGVYGAVAETDGEKERQVDIVERVWGNDGDRDLDDHVGFLEQLEGMGLTVFDPNCSEKELLRRQIEMTRVHRPADWA